MAATRKRGEGGRGVDGGRHQVPNEAQVRWATKTGTVRPWLAHSVALAKALATAPDGHGVPAAMPSAHWSSVGVSYGVRVGKADGGIVGTVDGKGAGE